MGGRPLEALALIGLGIDRLSITPAAVGPIKAMIRSVNRAAVMAEMETLLAHPSRDLRGALTHWAGEPGVDIGAVLRVHPPLVVLRRELGVARQPRTGRESGREI